MQPLYSVDHETRQNAHRSENNSPNVREETPLLHRFPQREVQRNPFMMIAVSMLILLLITGVIIGIYLLVLQSNSENVLPPIVPLQMVSSKQWRALASPDPAAPLDTLPFTKAKQVVVVQTDSEQCYDVFACSRLLFSLLANPTSGKDVLPYNFLVSSDGHTFEALGWHRPSSPMYPEYPDSVLLAFIGNFTQAPPSKLQIEEAINLIAESERRQRLEASYSVFGKNTAYKPTYLFNSLKSLPHWRNDLTDV